MLERLQQAPDQIVGLHASGAVMAQEVEEAIGPLARRGGSVPAGLVIVVDRDCDGYYAELARGLVRASLAHRSLVRLAVVTEAEGLEEARVSGFDLSAVPVRFFAAADLRAALDWAAASRRGE
jgi:hypothetical protein